MIYGGQSGLSDLEQFVDRAIADIGPRLHEWDSIVVRGVSGIVVGAPVALALDKPLVIVRKPDEPHHACDHKMIVNYLAMGQRCLFLDDFVDSGRTLEIGRAHV